MEKCLYLPSESCFRLSGQSVRLLPEYLTCVASRYGTAIFPISVQAKHFKRDLAKQCQFDTAEEIFPVLLPPVSEQQVSVAILQAWDEAIKKLEALCQAKLRRRDGVAQRVLASTQLIRKRKPKDWKITTFGEVFTERQQRNCGLDSDSVVTVGKYAIRKQSKHFTRSVASSDLSNYWLISPGDFVYDPMSAYYGALGQYADDADGVVSPAYRVIRLHKVCCQPSWFAC